MSLGNSQSHSQICDAFLCAVPQRSTDFVALILVPPPAALGLAHLLEHSTSGGSVFWMEGEWIAWESIAVGKARERYRLLEMGAGELALTAVLLRVQGRSSYLVINNSGVVGGLYPRLLAVTPRNLILRRSSTCLNDTPLGHYSWMSPAEK